MLSTEHWSLLASRNLAWNESFARVGMFLSTLSFATVALALVAQASAFGPEFRLFALVVLPVVLFLGVGTMLRLDNSNHHDVVCIIGMNRIRAAYLELSPDLQRIFVMGVTDGFQGIETTMGVLPRRSLALSFVASTPFQLTVLNSVLLAAIAGLLLFELGTTAGVALAGGVAGFVVGLAIFSWYQRRLLADEMGSHRPLFPDAVAEKAAGA